MKRTPKLTCLLVAACLVPVGTPAQSGAARGRRGDAQPGAVPAALPPSTLPSDAATLYEDAEEFLKRKFDEFDRKRVPYTEEAEAQARQQQRELAARHAAQLNARGNLRGADFYYLGLLHQLAGQSEGVIEPLRRFLADSAADSSADKLKLQRARQVIASQSAKLDRLEEAEAAFAEYARGEPTNALDTFRLRLALAAAYERAGKLEQAAAHAREAFRAAKDARTTRSDYVGRAQVINAAGTLLANLLLRLKRNDEALAVMKELLALGLTLPSAHVYGGAVELLSETGNTRLVERSIEESAHNTAPAPEIEAAQWIDQRPVRLAELRGQVVLLDFWATWCAPCRLTMPQLSELQARYKSRGLVVLGLTQLYGNASGQTPAEELAALRAFRRELKLSYGFAVAADAANQLRYGVRSLPATFLIDRRGVVRYASVGAVDSSGEVLEGVVKRLLDEKP